jgi:hypothetical protein
MFPPEISQMKFRFQSLLTSTVCVSVLAAALLAAMARAEDTVEPSHIRQASATPPASNVTIISPGEVAATPQMWFYEQSLARYNDPKTAIRAAAEFKSAQRRARMAAMQWYGLSNSRPAAGIDPVDGPWGPQWIGNGYNPNTWVAPGATMWVIPGVASGY